MLLWSCLKLSLIAESKRLFMKSCCLVTHSGNLKFIHIQKSPKIGPNRCARFALLACLCLWYCFMALLRRSEAISVKWLIHLILNMILSDASASKIIHGNLADLSDVRTLEIFCVTCRCDFIMSIFIYIAANLNRNTFTIRAC